MMWKRLIFEVIFVVLLLILVFNVLGCSPWLISRPEVNETPTVVPTPAKQLADAARKSNWLVTACIFGIGLGVFAMMGGSTKLGMAAIASSSVSLFMALAVSRFALWMAVFGLIGSAAAALFSILARRKALFEIIKGVQNYKSAERLNLDESTVDLLRNRLKEQSETTKKIVGNIKNNLKLAGKI